MTLWISFYLFFFGVPLFAALTALPPSRENKTAASVSKIISNASEEKSPKYFIYFSYFKCLLSSKQFLVNKQS